MICITLRRLNFFLLVATAILFTGCIKETYDMNKLSGEGSFSPTLAFAAVKGNVSFSDLVKSGDTVVFDENKFVRLIFRKDSIINLNLKDFYDFDDMVSFSRSYQMGVLSLGSFEGSLSVSLFQITQYLQPSLRDQIRALDDGVAHDFPPLPQVNLGERTFTAFNNLDYAVFESGYLDISVTNNLTTPLSDLNIDLINSPDRTVIGTVTIPPVLPGQTQKSSLDLTDKRITGTVIAEIVLTGSPGTTSPVIISLNNSNIQVTARGRDLKVKSGRIILPPQKITTLDNRDTISFDPGYGIELDEINISKGNLSYQVLSGTALAVSMNIVLPSVTRNGSVLTHTINAGSGTNFDGSISFDNTTIDLGTDPAHPYNSLPLEYSIDVGSGNIMIDYNSTDKIDVELRLTEPEFGYVKGYFGQQSESVEPDTLNLDIDDILNRLSGDFLISSPSIRLNYSNSFAIPLKFDFRATGTRGKESVNLGLDPIVIASPQYPSGDVSSSIVIDKNNSELPELISLPPGKLIFSGAAIMNPEGNTGLRDNYVFGNSRFVGSMEVEVPLEFRMNNLQYTDTIDNFLRDSDGSSDSPVKPENFKLLKLSLTAKNGFPLGVSVKMSLFDEKTQKEIKTINAESLLAAAPVDANGRANGVKETTTSLELTKEFFDAVKNAGKIIVWFTLNTTSPGDVDVKIYSDYRIDFKAALILKPVIILN
jgi:hypothetical protein